MGVGQREEAGDDVTRHRSRSPTIKGKRAQATLMVARSIGHLSYFTACSMSTCQA